MNLIARLLISALAVLITSYLISGVHVDNLQTAVLVAIILACLNTFLKPLLILLALPAVIFSFGLFLIIINTFIIILTDNLVNGFRVDGFGNAFAFSVILWLITSILNSVKQDNEKTEY